MSQREAAASRRGPSARHTQGGAVSSAVLREASRRARVATFPLCRGQEAKSWSSVALSPAPQERGAPSFPPARPLSSSWRSSGFLEPSGKGHLGGHAVPGRLCSHFLLWGFGCRFGLSRPGMLFFVGDSPFPRCQHVVEWVTTDACSGGQGPHK